MGTSSDDLTVRQSLGEPAPERPRLVALWDDGSASVELPSKGRVTIGRGESCDLRIDHPSVSRQHAAVHVGSPVRVEDLGSSNGTFFAGRRLVPHEACPLPPDTLVRVGEVLVVLRSAHEGLDMPAPVPPRAGSAPSSLEGFVSTAAGCALPVILLGETGVGKGVLAEGIHQASSRAKRPLVRLNCAALPEALLESELFGHERGAFTGAVQAKPGLLEAADGGTLLLDEVGEMPLGTQAKLLHVVEHGEVLRLGSLRPRKIDVRFIAATNRDLEALVESGSFRRDLYFRLAGLTVEIPPLRERKAELPVLAQDLFGDACRRMGQPAPRLASEVVAELLAHRWPGNIRELKNAMARLALTGRLDLATKDPVAVAHPKPEGKSDPMEKMQRDMRELEKQRLIEALARCAGSQTRAAALLGISRRTLTKRMNEFGLPRPRKPVPD